MFRLFIPMPSLDSPAYQYLQSEIEKLPNKEEFKDLFIKNIRTCTFCNPDCVKWNAYKKDWIILGRPVGKLIRSCEFAVAAYTFNKENYTFFSQLIDIFIRMIDLQLI